MINNRRERERVPYTLQIRCGKEGGGKGALIQVNMSATLSCANTQYLFQPIQMENEHDAPMATDKYIVRRLTPTECARLQGFPDWWCDGVQGSDSAQYKMWGNGMCLFNLLYIFQGIKEVLSDEHPDI